MAQSDRTIYEFGRFRLDPAENLLLKDGEPISLKPKVFSILVLLVEQRGRLVEKTELMDEVWGDSFVEEAAISKCIWNVRAALEDSEKKQFIQTIPKRGYRFIADVAETQVDVDNGSRQTVRSKPEALKRAADRIYQPTAHFDIGSGVVDPAGPNNVRVQKISQTMQDMII
jgi:DNA-binding winged helix-turn-helix (wHTH) protein